MALPLTTTTSVTSSRASSPMEEETENTLFMAVAMLNHSLTRHSEDPRLTANSSVICMSFEPLSALRPLINKLIRALSAQVCGLIAIVHQRLPPPEVAAPAPPTKQPSAQPHPKPTPPPRAHPPKASALVPAPLPPPPTPSYASTACKPVRPSLIMSKKLNPEATQPLAVCHSPSDICAHLNAALSTSHPTVSLSAASSTPPPTYFISDTLSSFLSYSTSDPLPVSAKENVRWSRLLINNLPTGVTASHGAYSPEECQDTLARNNPVYQSLRLTRLPSWVKRPDGYAVNTSSSLVVTFEDPTGSTLSELLGHGSLFAFRHQGHLKRWKQKPRAKPSIPPTDRPLAPA
ncbi:hypothetical protein EDB85DRAFT_2145113 [Lactarius pseudohatsudake]|nr:hypothetical protein EDB85DRAFT_2145113 [Lactarius pseudohatsudake]